MPKKNNQIETIQKKLDMIWDTIGNNPKNAYTDSKEIENTCIEINYSKGIKESRLHQGWCLIYMSKLREAIEILTDLSGDFKKEEASEDHIKVLNALGVAYNDLGDNTNAFYYYSRSLKLSREAGLLDRELSVLNNMGGYFLDNNNYNKALSHYKEILEKAEDSEQSLELKSAVLSNTGICYSKLKQYEAAERYLLQSRILSKQINNQINYVDSLHELAVIKFAQNEIETAKKYINDALEICKETDNKRAECELLIMLGDIQDDGSLYEKALNLSFGIKYKPIYSTACLKFSTYLEKSKHHEKSLYYIKEHYKTENELNNLATEKKFHNLEMEYEIERNRKNAEIFKIQNLELRESLNWMSIVSKIARETMSSLELDSIFDTVYKNINILMGAELFHVVFYNSKEDRLDVVNAIENGNVIKPFTFSADEKSSFAAWSIKNRKEVIVNNLEKDYSKYINKRAYYGDGPRAKSSLTVPIFLRNNEIGALAILSYHENAYKEEHVQLLKSLAAYLSIAIENSRNFEKVKELNKIILMEKEELEAANKKITELATHDNLTGLANRRIFNELLESAMLQANRRGETLAVLFIDLDNFKPVNDTWGHDAGDKVLVEIAERLKSILRSTDSVARIGGDEFLILLNPVKNKSEARKVAEKIIKKVSSPIIFNEINTSIGMSIGISVYPEQETTADQLIIYADSAMYKIKKGDKNGIGFFKKDQ